MGFLNTDFYAFTPTGALVLFFSERPIFCMLVFDEIQQMQGTIRAGMVGTVLKGLIYTAGTGWDTWARDSAPSTQCHSTGGLLSFTTSRYQGTKCALIT